MARESRGPEQRHARSGPSFVPFNFYIIPDIAGTGRNDFTTMIFVVDRDIPFAGEMFSGRAEVRLFPGDEIDTAAVRDADVLLVRSPTRVTSDLLSGSSVRFVGTATIGYDHIDVGYLGSKGISFARAPGCNSTSVAEYVVAALLEAAGRFDLRLDRLTLGVVGVGNVGSRVAARASAMGMTVLRNDPPLERESASGGFVPMDALMEADIVTLHVPLTKSGPDPTWHLFDEKRISAMKPGSILLNTARGAVVDTAALKRSLRGGHLRAAVIDVWEGEPAIDTEALSLAAIGTAHIAGYSADAKLNGARMIYEAACEFLGWEKTWRPSRDLPRPMVPEVRVGGAARDMQETLRDIVTACYPIMRDDAGLRAMSALPPDQRPAHFTGLRNNYPVRREFRATRVSLAGTGGPLGKVLGGLGFEVR